MGFVLPLIVAIIAVWIAFSIVVWATGRDTLLDLSPAGAPLGLGEEEPVSEAAVASVRFDTGMRGYRTDQVDAALNRLAWEIGRKDEQLAVLNAKLDGTYEEPTTEENEFVPAPSDDLPGDEPFQEPAAAEDEPFEEALDEDTFRIARGEDAEPAAETNPEDAESASAADRDDAEPGSEARRQGDGETPPRTEA